GRIDRGGNISYSRWYGEISRLSVLALACVGSGRNPRSVWRALLRRTRGPFSARWRNLRLPVGDVRPPNCIPLRLDVPPSARPRLDRGTGSRTGQLLRVCLPLFSACHQTHRHLRNLDALHIKCTKRSHRRWSFALDNMVETRRTGSNGGLGVRISPWVVV